MLVQGALNGNRERAAHAAIPLTAAELARDAVACVTAGAGAFHVHPRDARGRESLDPEVINRAVATIRHATRVPVGVSTGAWIEPDLDRRLVLISGWTEPDYASVNLSEAGATAVMAALLGRGIGIEAGIWTVEDVEALVRTGFADRVLRVLIEVGEEQVGSDREQALREVGRIHSALDRAGVTAPRLQHGDGAVTWVVLSDALERGVDTRVGFEDTLWLPDGQLAGSNAELARAALGA